MVGIALVTGADRGLGFSLCEGLLKKGWKVFAGQYMPEWLELATLKTKYPENLFLVSLDAGSTESVGKAAEEVSLHTGHIDLLINNAGITAGKSELRSPINYSAMKAAFNVNTLGSLRVVKAFLPLTDNSSLKRLCFISSEAGSIGLTRRKDGYGYCITKTALNMAVNIMFNDLRPEGYSFRLYQPGWMKSYMRGVKSTTGDIEPVKSAASALEQFVNSREDEDRLVLIDYKGCELAF
jgi:NAD(P)-dependent dehydrogenase (short-subunit alcohol dehydrogenase family)